MSGTAIVELALDYDDVQLEAVRRRAAELDAENIGSDARPCDYSPAEAFARVLATDPRVVDALMWQFSNGYTAEEKR